MSEKNNVGISLTEKDGYLESEKGPMEEHDHKLALHSDESPPAQSIDVPAELEDVQGDRQPIEPVTNEELRTPERNMEAADSSSSEQQLTTPDAPTEPKFLERRNDIYQSMMKYTDISPSLVPSSDEGLKQVMENIQHIYDGLDGMKLSEQEAAISASGRKGRKPAGTPRAKNTQHLTSPPLTRSRSRDLMKLSTPASPGRVAARKDSDSDSDEIKGVRGRQRVRKN